MVNVTLPLTAPAAAGVNVICTSPELETGEKVKAALLLAVATGYVACPAGLTVKRAV